MKYKTISFILVFCCVDVLAMESAFFQARSIAEEYQRLIKQASKASQMKTLVPGALLGDVAFVEEVDRSFYQILHEYRKELPGEVGRVYDFLEESGFISNVGYFFLKPLMEKRSTGMGFELKREIEKAYPKHVFIDGETLSIIAFKSTSLELFDGFRNGIFLRDKSQLASISNIDNSMKWLFQQKTELIELLATIRDIGQRVLGRQQILKDILFSNGSPGNILKTLAESPAAPQLVKQRVNALLKEQMNEENLEKFVKQYKDILIMDIITNTERVAGLEYICPAPIDMALV